MGVITQYDFVYAGLSSDIIAITPGVYLKFFCFCYEAIRGSDSDLWCDPLAVAGGNEHGLLGSG